MTEQRRGFPIEQPLAVPVCAACKRLIEECDADPCPVRKAPRGVRHG